MDRSRQEMIELLFEAALERPKEERYAYLNQACNGDVDLQRAIEQLLCDHEAAGSFLQKPLLDWRSESTRDITEPARLLTGSGEAFFRTGDIIKDRYEIVRFIDHGGMGEVYEVKDRDLHDVHVALKVIRPEVSGDPAMQARFEREVLAARQVVHPHLCPNYNIDHCNTDPRGPFCFLTMKFLPGETLAARLKRQGTLSLQEVDAIVHQIGAGLAAAHKAGIIHRDIKPSNIMLDGAETSISACLTDFGLARSLYVNTTLISVNEVAGTIGYLAPELFQGQPPNLANDIYSFGVVTYEMLMGRPPTFPLKALSPKRTKPEFHHLPAKWQKLITGCLEADVSRRYASMQMVLDELDDSGRRISRRTAIRLGVGATVAMGGTAWLEWPNIEFLFSPLPDRRFVALMAWPTPRSEDAGLLSMILESIKDRLARAEAYVRDLLIVSSADNVAPPSQAPADAPHSLGANLVLAGAIHQQHSTLTLTLQVLNAATQKVIRRGHVKAQSSQPSELVDQGYSLAARVLDLKEKKLPIEDSDQLRILSPEAYREFTEAEFLANEPNNAGLDAAIEKYESVLAIAPKFSLAYAEIAIAYVRKFVQSGGRPCLDLAERNANLALDNPRSVRALLSKALVCSYTGKTKEALEYFDAALKLDPENPDVLLYKAHTFRDLNRPKEEEQAYRDLLKVRPNYWLAYNELGWILWRQARYEEAKAAFEAASATAPAVALPIANLSSMYMDLGKFDDAVAAAQRSLAKYPNATAYLNLGDIAFSRGNYRDALSQYEKAAELSPKNHVTQRNIGDCYAMFGQKSMVRVHYAKAAELLADDLKTNPQGGFNWMTLAFYHAKTGDYEAAKADLAKAAAQGASDVESQLTKAQALMLLGKREDALAIVLNCLDKGLSPGEIDAALDLAELRKDPRYKSHLAALNSPSHKTTS